MTPSETIAAVCQILVVMITMGTLICTLIGLSRLAYAGRKLEVIHVQTNSLTERLVEATGAARFEAGKLEGQAQIIDPAIAIAAAKLLQEAAIQAAKVLATAKRTDNG